MAIPFVAMSYDYEPAMFDLATYGEINGEPGRYEPGLPVARPGIETVVSS